MSDGATGVVSVTDEPPVSGRPPWEPAAAPGPAPGQQPAAAGRPSADPGGRPPRARRGRWWSVLPYLIVLAGAGTGLWWTWQGPQRVRGGTLAIAGALLVAALARLVLPEAWAGMLASRKRLTDVVTLVALAAGLLAAGLLLPTSS